MPAVGGRRDASTAAGFGVDTGRMRPARFAAGAAINVLRAPFVLAFASSASVVLRTLLRIGPPPPPTPLPTPLPTIPPVWSTVVHVRLVVAARLADAGAALVALTSPLLLCCFDSISATLVSMLRTLALSFCAFKERNQSGERLPSDRGKVSNSPTR